MASKPSSRITRKIDLTTDAVVWRPSEAALFAEAASSIRKLADNLDKRTDEISAGLVRFSNSGLKQYEAFAVDGRRTLGELQKVIKGINDHPSQLIFGR